MHDLPTAASFAGVQEQMPHRRMGGRPTWSNAQSEALEAGCDKCKGILCNQNALKRTYLHTNFQNFVRVTVIPVNTLVGERPSPTSTSTRPTPHHRLPPLTFRWNNAPAYHTIAYYLCQKAGLVLNFLDWLSLAYHKSRLFRQSFGWQKSGTVSCWLIVHRHWDKSRVIFILVDFVKCPRNGCDGVTSILTFVVVVVVVIS